jgi:hypothetical protein
MSYMNSSPLLLSFIPPCPISGVVATGIISAFTYMGTHFLHHIHPPIPIPQHLLSPTTPDLPSGKICSSLLFSDFVEEKGERIK